MQLNSAAPIVMAISGDPQQKSGGVQNIIGSKDYWGQRRSRIARHTLQFGTRLPYSHFLCLKNNSSNTEFVDQWEQFTEQMQLIRGEKEE